MSATAKQDAVESVDQAIERVLCALEWTHADSQEATLELVGALGELRCARRQIAEVREVPPRADAVFTKAGSRKRGARG